MIKYPHKYKNAEVYAHALSTIYQQNYPDIKKEYIKAIIEQIIDSIEYCIKGKNDVFVLTKINNVRGTLTIPDEIPSEEKLCQLIRNNNGSISIYGYKKGSPDAVERALSASGIEYPEDQKQRDQLSKFTSEVTIKCATEICEATEKAIRKQESEKSWIEKSASSKKRSTVGAEEAPQRRPRLSFAETLKPKSPQSIISST